jgi:hypothetical protein
MKHHYAHPRCDNVTTPGDPPDLLPKGIKGFWTKALFDIEESLDQWKRNGDAIANGNAWFEAKVLEEVMEAMRKELVRKSSANKARTPAPLSNNWTPKSSAFRQLVIRKAGGWRSDLADCEEFVIASEGTIEEAYAATKLGMWDVLGK